MSRVKGGVVHTKHRRGILKHTKGYRWGRKSKMKVAKTAVMKAGQHAFNDRKIKKRTARGLWQIKINAAVRKEGISYSKFMNDVKKKNIALDRKILATIAQKYPALLKQIVELAKTI